MTVWQSLQAILIQGDRAVTRQTLWILSNLSDFMSKSVLDFCLLILFLSPIYKKFPQKKFLQVFL